MLRLKYGLGGRMCVYIFFYHLLRFHCKTVTKIRDAETGNKNACKRKVVKRLQSTGFRSDSEWIQAAECKMNMRACANAVILQNKSAVAGGLEIFSLTRKERSHRSAVVVGAMRIERQREDLSFRIISFTEAHGIPFSIYIAANGDELRRNELLSRICIMKYLSPLLIVICAVTVTGCQKQGCCSDTKQPPAMKRYCLTLDLKDDPALIAEYRHWHDSKNIWPEIPKGIRDVGIKDMEIYLLGTRLFMIMEAPADFDFDKQMAKLAELPRQKEWEAFVSKFQKSSPDAKSSEKWKMMDRIFKLRERIDNG
jgi:L-rhamnose mutarotase